LELEVPF